MRVPNNRFYGTLTAPPSSSSYSVGVSSCISSMLTLTRVCFSIFLMLNAILIATGEQLNDTLTSDYQTTSTAAVIPALAAVTTWKSDVNVTDLQPNGTLTSDYQTTTTAAVIPALAAVTNGRIDVNVTDLQLNDSLTREHQTTTITAVTSQVLRTTSNVRSVTTAVFVSACVPSQWPMSYTTSAGVINSPNYPNNYPVNTDCRWLITASSNAFVHIFFKYFNTDDCCDFVFIYDGNTITAPYLAKLSGLLTSIPPYRTSQRYLLLRMTTDGIGARSGFNSTWILTHANKTACNDFTVLNDVSGSLGTLQYPYGYDKFSCRQWLIVAQLGEVVELHFEYFKTVAFYDKVEVFDGNSTLAPRIQLLSGNASNIMGAFLSSDRYMFILFTASNTDIDTANSSFGFNATYVSLLDGVMECNASLCANDSICVPGRKNCQCRRGYTGSDCSERLAASYLGCFPDESYSSTILDQRTIYFDKTLTWTRCVQHCANLGYVFAGIKEGIVCACGQIAFSAVSRVFCNTPCKGDNSQEGGSRNMLTMLQITTDQEQCYGQCPDQELCINNQCDKVKSCRDYPCDSHSNAYSTCVDVAPNDYVCECPIGYFGDACLIYERPIKCSDEDCCYGKQCLNGGTCYWFPSLNTAACVCLTSAYGASCEYVTLSACVPSLWPENYDTSKGEIHSPNYPNNYPANSECRWLVTAPLNAFVQIDFHDFYTDLDSDYVYVYDGDTTSSPYLAELSGRLTDIPPYRTTQRYMLLTIITDDFAAYPGFNATWTHIFENLFPLSSPFRGGTLVTYLFAPKTNSTQRTEAIGFGEPTIWVPVITSSSTNATARTPPMDDQLNSALVVKVFVKFSDDQTTFTHELQSFKFYYSRMNISSLDASNFYIYTGGIQLDIAGTFPGLTTGPILLVRTSSRIKDGPGWQTVNGKYQSVCAYRGNDAYGVYKSINCITPAVTIPLSIRNYLDSASATQDDVSLRRGRVVDNYNNSIEIYVGLLFSDNPNIQNIYQDFSLLNMAYKMVLTSGPVVVQWDDIYQHQRGVDYWKPIEVYNGLYGINSPLTDYVVYLEGKPGTVTGWDPNEATLSLQYSGPSTKNLSTSDAIPDIINFKCENDSLHLQVRVGYRIQRVGCVEELYPCNPSPCVNEAKCEDHWDYYTCFCTRYFFNINCSSPYPNITAVDPSYGPVAGGTNITINLRVPDYFDVTGVFLGDDQVSYEIETLETEVMDTTFTTSENDGSLFNVTLTRYVLTQRIVVTSFSVTTGPRNVPVSIEFTWTGNENETSTPTYPWQSYPFLLNITSDVPFQYRANPTISDAYPIQQLYTGGTTLTVVGLNMNASAAPILTLFLSASWTFTANFGARTETAYDPASSICTVNSTTKMLCKLPSLRVPDALLAMIELKQYNASSMSGSVIGAKTLGPNTYESWEKSGCRSNEITQKALTTSLNNVLYSTTYLEVKSGFTFDGYTDYRMQDNWQLDVYPPPYFCTDTKVVYDGVTEIQVKGNHLLRAASVSDYTVQVEDIPFIIVGITNNYLSFRTETPLTRTPTFDSSQSNRCSKNSEAIYQINVRVGWQWFFAGCADWNTSVEVNQCEGFVCYNGGTCNRNYATDKVKCLCDTQLFYGDRCQFGSPRLTSLTPDIGPQSGNTSVTIEGQWPSTIEPVAVLFNSTPINRNDVKIDFEQILVRSPKIAVPVTDAGLPVVVSVRFNDSTTWNFTGNTFFTYMPDPTFSSVHPRDHITSGGTVISIEGTNLNVTRTATMTIVIVTQAQKKQEYDALPPAVITTIPTRNCTEHLGTFLVCRMPPTQAPNKFLSLLDQSTFNTEALLLRRKRQSSYEESDVLNNDSSMTSHYRVKRDLTGLIDDSTGDTMNVFVLLQMDGFSKNLSEVLPNATLLLHNPPQVFKPNGVIPVFVNRSQTVELQGYAFTLGTKTDEDIFVYVGGYLLPHSDITVYVNRTRIRPPDEILPNMTSLDSNNETTSLCTESGEEDISVNLTNTFSVEIHIGYAVYQAGCIEYLDDLPPVDYQRLLGIYIGVSIAGALLIALAIILLAKL